MNNTGEHEFTCLLFTLQGSSSRRLSGLKYIVRLVSLDGASAYANMTLGPVSTPRRRPDAVEWFRSMLGASSELKALACMEHDC